MSRAAADYEEAIKELTFNSKPLISSLTMVAQESQAYAAEIVRVIERRIETVSPELKLPTLYLLDSICKNVGGLFNQAFTQRLPQTFSHVWFTAPDNQSRDNLRHLVGTWVGVFPAEIVSQIETMLEAPMLKPNFMSKHALAIHVNPRFMATWKRPRLAATEPPPQLTTAPLRPALFPSLFSQPAAITPAPAPVTPTPLPAAPTQPVPAAAPPPAVPALDYERMLDALLRHTQPAVPAGPAPPTEPPPSYLPPAPIAPAPPGGYPPPPQYAGYLQPSPPPPPGRYPLPPETGYYPPPPSPPPGSYAPPPRQYPPPPAGYGGYPPPPQPSAGLPPPLPPSADEKVTFKSNLKISRPALITSLYHGLPHQCNTCGIRFSQKLILQRHHDWHFKLNQRRRLGEIASRMWWPSAEQWCNTLVDVEAPPLDETVSADPFSTSKPPSD
ncbi:putative mrna cleavage factor complex component [Paratrimastix pyriformis]|uniref:Mrna cleavage factor complex component n=1 Tax=Paratrimastix pyriformis TaxID=342808 RepID=A0ABQ8U642_9EUKA|nr:putative mrna cleavage factor complex component [Paratrimastix pyriformis]